jgi:hypothetical protein
MHPIRSLVVLAAGFLAACTSITPLQLNALPEDAPRRVAATFDHSRLDRLLQGHVNAHGLVDYGGLLQELQELDACLQSLATVDVGSLASDNERKAYWINAYNAITLAGILRHYPTRSIRDLSGFWQRITANCGGRVVSLDDIEHRILRPLGDPRIHMAINCASRSCPRLWNRAYTGAELDRQLDAAATAFLGDPGRNRFDDGGHRAQLSMIFSWFGGDFDVAPYLGVRGFVRRFAPRLSWIADDFPITFLPYDWSLNEGPR